MLLGPSISFCSRLRTGCRDIFGGQATEAKVLAELQGYSDFDLHALARSNGGAFAKFLLEDSRLFGSAKCCFLAKLLPELKVGTSCQNCTPNS